MPDEGSSYEQARLENGAETGVTKHDRTLTYGDVVAASPARHRRYQKQAQESGGKAERVFAIPRLRQK